jgi:hypothetical protein
MATIIILLGGILGFGTAVTAYLAFGASLATALFIWAASGPVSALVAALAMVMRPRKPAQTPQGPSASSLPEIA